MELRHLRCFLAVANELHFTRAAEKLHIDQSPLSRTIKELEEDVGAQLFTRTTRSTRLTAAGASLLQQAPRVFLLLEQARDGIRAAAAGCDGRLRIALSDGISTPRLASLVALTCLEEPDLGIHFDEVSLAHQVKGLSDDLYDCGLCQSSDRNHGLRTELAWTEPLHVAMPVDHPLLAYKQIRAEDVLRYPLLLGHAESCAGYNAQIEKLFLQNSLGLPLPVQRVASFSLMMSLVSAGYALALIGESQMQTSRDTLIRSRPLADPQYRLSTYLLLRDRPAEPALTRLIDRLRRLDSHNDGPHTDRRPTYGELRAC
ncbi:LysR family transcriptional regulator [Billgrantia pellis]|uniref:LysR family transcriptional regulator n=1 Tax=Billgrantia pellis TaxID=2606936 RepID=A0A7V7KJ80_9GAMM|nr:LysR family transcriptional regulator [Halomonas pellis]KAA0013792.1 LysR family transcriptional regulator [Halomonas pellis]